MTDKSSRFMTWVRWEQDLKRSYHTRSKREEEHVTIGEPVLLQNGRGLAISAHLGEALTEGGPERAVLLAQGVSGVAVAIFEDQLIRNGKVCDELNWRGLVGLDEFEDLDVILQDRVDPSGADRGEFFGIGLERGNRDTDLPQIFVRSRTRDGAHLFALQGLERGNA